MGCSVAGVSFWVVCATVVGTAAVMAAVVLFHRRPGGLTRSICLHGQPAAGAEPPVITGPSADGALPTWGRESAAFSECEVTDLTDVELCRLWRCTYPPLVAPASSDHLEQLIEVRAAVLEELNRRDPAGWARWVDSGARAGGDPLRHLSSQRPSKRPPS